MIKTLIIIETLFIILLAVCLGFQVVKSCKQKQLTFMKAIIIFVLIAVTLIIIAGVLVLNAETLPKAALILTTAILLYESVTDVISYDIYTIPIYAGIVILLILGLVNASTPSGIVKIISFPMILCIVLEAVNYINNGYIGEGDILITEFLAFNSFSVQSRIYAFSLAAAITLLTLYRLGKSVFQRKIIAEENKGKESSESNESEDEALESEQGKRLYPLAPFIYTFYLIANILGVFQLVGR